MVLLALLLMTLAAALGTGLAIWHLRANEGGVRPPKLWVGCAHGGLGAVALGVLLLALRGPPRGVAAGAGSFGVIAAVLFAAALLMGLVVLARRRKRPSVIMAIHSGVAITGYALLLAWCSLG